jgi:hypothetical protein
MPGRESLVPALEGMRGPFRVEAVKMSLLANRVPEASPPSLKGCIYFLFQLLHNVPVLAALISTNDTIHTLTPHR